MRSAEGLPDDQDSRIIPYGDDTLLSSDHFKYRQALAVQRARNDPDTVYLDLKYHLAWNVAWRKPVFVRTADVRNIVDNAFYACGEQIGGFASVLWLAPDHVHVYVESDGARSIEAIVKNLKHVSASALSGELSSKDLSLGRNRRVWDRSYFAETIG